MIWTYTILVSLFGLAACQYDSPLPPRPVIPGAIPVGGGGGRQVGRTRGAAPPSRGRGFSVLDEQDIVARPRIRPPPQALPPQRIPRIRPQPQVIPSVQSLLSQPKPVIEEVEDQPSILDDEPLFQIAQQSSPAPPRPTHLEDYPRPQPSPKPLPPAPKNIDDLPISRPPPPPRPQFRNTIQEEDLDIPTRTLPLEPVRGRPQYRPAPSPSPLPPQAPSRGSPPRQQQLSRPNKNKLSEPVDKEPQHSRPRKPVSQVIRKYREDNEDGSITWGFENDDGTYKEETIGIDCVTRGKYGYFDPEGVRREFTYSSGIPCERRDQLDDAEQQGSEHGYIDYSNNKYVMANGDSVDLDHMVKNRARQPVHSQQYYRN